MAKLDASLTTKFYRVKNFWRIKQFHPDAWDTLVPNCIKQPNSQYAISRARIFKQLYQRHCIYWKVNIGKSGQLQVKRRTIEMAYEPASCRFLDHNFFMYFPTTVLLPFTKLTCILHFNICVWVVCMKSLVY